MRSPVRLTRLVRGASRVFLVGSVAGCAYLWRPPDPSPRVAEAVLVRAINRSAGTIELWIHARFQVRLGCIAAGDAAEFVIPADLPAGEGPIRLIAWPRPSGHPIASGPLHLAAGRMVRFTIVEAPAGLDTRLRAAE